MNLTYRSALFLLLGAVLVVGCSAEPTLAPASPTLSERITAISTIAPAPVVSITLLSATLTPYATSSATPELTPTPTLVATPSATPSFYPVLPDPTIEAYLVSHAARQCLTIRASSLPALSISGKLVIAKKNDENQYKYPFLLDLDSGERKSLMNKDEIPDSMGVSLDNKWFAYVTSTKENPEYSLFIVSASGKPELLEKSTKSYGIWGWATGGRLLLSDPLDRIRVFNPFTKDEYFIGTKFPDWNNLTNPLEITWVYSPDLRYVVYEFFDGKAAGKRLFDALAWKPIKDISAIRPYPAAWSPDGSQFVFPNAQNFDSNGPVWEKPDITLFIGSRDGTIRKAINQQDLSPSMIYDWYTWSPTGDRIAVWVGPSKTETGGFVNILDVQTGVLMNSCITSNQAYESNKFGWSPDGKQIAFRIFDENQKANLIIANLETGEGVQLDEDAAPIGWLVEP